MIDQLNALPPAPDFPLDSGTLARRFDSEPWLATWLGQQQDGPYWRRASLRPDYSRLTIPAFLIGGWYDGYRDSVPRMLAEAAAPVKMLIGPWNHTFPHNAVPGPAIEWRTDADPMVGSLAQGRRQRDHVGAAGHRVRPALVPAGPEPDRNTRPVADRGSVPARAHHLSARGTAVRSATCCPSRRLTAQWRCVTCPRPAWRPVTGGASSPRTSAARTRSAWSSTPRRWRTTWRSSASRSWRSAVSTDADPTHWFGRLSDVAPDGTVTLVTGRPGGPARIRCGTRARTSPAACRWSCTSRPGCSRAATGSGSPCRTRCGR